MINALLIDDNHANIKTLSKLIGLYCPQVTICGTAQNIEEGHREILKHRPDLVFLDIEMPRGNGFELLKKFDPLAIEVIFTTAYSQYAVQAFREDATDYLIKPIDIDALQQAVAKAETRHRSRRNGEHTGKPEQEPRSAPVGKISIPVLDGYLFMNYQDIIRCEASGCYTNFYTIDGKKLVTSMRLKECETLLPPGQFFRIHRSHIINLRYMVRYQRGRGGYVIMEDKSTVEVAANRKEVFLEQMKHGF